MIRSLAAGLLLAALLQDEPILPVSRDLASLYRYATECRFTRVTDRRLLWADAGKLKTADAVREAGKVAAGEGLIVTGDIDAPLTVGDGGFLEVGGSLKADLDAGAGSAILVRGGVGKGVKLTLRDTQFVLGGRVDGMITIEGAATDLFFAGPRPDPDQVLGTLTGLVVFRDLLSAEDENLWFRAHPQITIIARAAAKAEFRLANDGAGRVLLVLPDSPSLHRCLMAVAGLAPALTKPFCDPKFQKTLAAAKPDGDGGKRVRIPSQASVAWFAALKEDVTVRERVGVTVVDGDLATGRSLRLGKVDGASSNLVVITGSLSGTLDISEDRGAVVIVGGDVSGVILSGSDQRVLVRGSVLKGATIQLRAGSPLTVMGSDESGTLPDAVRKVDGSACTVGRGAKAGSARMAGSGVFAVLEAQ
jgi:hypothetical protein